MSAAVQAGRRSHLAWWSSTSLTTDWHTLSSATCPAGKEAFGTGFALNGFRGRLNIREIYPTNVGTAFSDAEELVSTTNNWSLTTDLICADA